MDFNTAVSIIKKDLEEARSLLEQLSVTPGIPIAEMELARSRIRSASELLSILPKVKESAADTIVPPIPENTNTTMIEEAPVKGEEKEEMIQEPVNKPAPAVEVKESGVTTKAKDPENPKTIFADKFSASDRLGEKKTNIRQDEVIASVISARPVVDIASAIGINDRFYFIRELFSGDSLAYNDTIKRLNSATSLGEAMKILDDSTVMGSDPAAQSAFVDVVRRKFNINV